MPCYSPPPTREEIERSLESEYKDKSEKMEAALCACINFARAEGKLHDMLNSAKKNSGFDLAEFAEKHAQDDAERVAMLLRSYFSQDELMIVKALCSSGKS